MSDAQNQGEPTMEEILASIRKIISEDGTPEGEEGEDQEAAAAESAEEDAPAAEPEPEPAAAEAAPEEAPADDAASDDAAGEAAEDGDDEVLELTQMVGEDGGIVDLNEEQQDAAEAAPEPEPAELPEDIPELIAVEDLDDMEPAEEPQPAAAAAEVAADDSLLANTTQSAVTSSLAEMAVAAAPVSAMGGLVTGNDKTLEVLVREVLEPYLKTWLDENLAGMVERIVRDEVQKMARRAEYR